MKLLGLTVTTDRPGDTIAQLVRQNETLAAQRSRLATYAAQAEAETTLWQAAVVRACRQIDGLRAELERLRAEQPGDRVSRAELVRLAHRAEQAEAAVAALEARLAEHQRAGCWPCGVCRGEEGGGG